MSHIHKKSVKYGRTDGQQIQNRDTDVQDGVFLCLSYKKKNQGQWNLAEWRHWLDGLGTTSWKMFQLHDAETKLQFIFKALKRHKTENPVFRFCFVLFRGIAQVNVLCEGDYICFTSL